MQYQMEKIKILFFIWTLSITLGMVGCAQKEDAQQILGNISQNITDYINPAVSQIPLLEKEQQSALSQDYLQHFFSPWTGQKVFYDNKTIKEKEFSFVQQFEQAPGFGENQQYHTKAWITQIKDNMNMDVSFGQHPQKAIVTEASDLRVLPTMDPSYGSLTKAGEYYPFDLLQESYVSIGTPILIIQSSKEGAWDLILLHNGVGWISHQHIAYVDDDFIKKYQAMPMGVITADHTGVNVQGKFAFSGRMGAIYPVPENAPAALYIPVREENQQAVIALANTDKNNLSLFPVLFTPKNMAALIQPILGNPYGWGSLYAYRDCSATTEDLLASFGVWLPRNSGEQMKTGNPLSLASMNRKQKEVIIASQGIPFLTLIGMPGHVMLYLGQYQGKSYVLQTIWGLHTKVPFFEEGRAVIGQTVITPLDFDGHFLDVPTKFVDKVNGMTNL
jgi:hypothetical protein